MKAQLTDIECRIQRETERAIGIDIGNTEKVGGRTRAKLYWLPKQHAEYDSDMVGAGKVTVVTIPEWLAIEKGLA